MKKLLATAALLALAMPVAASAQAVTPAITAALADPSRPADQRARDTARHAAEVLAFSGVKPGDKVVDFMMGGGYWTCLLSPLVGPGGRVYAFQPDEFIRFNADYATQQAAAVAGRANVTAVNGSIATFDFGAPVDVIITVQNWHDLHLAMSPPGAGAYIAARLFAALKPGGTLLVIDHVANTDPGFAVPNALHRIDPAAARKEIESAGFVFDGELNVLRNPADPHTVRVFDMHDQTDQFIYRFRKPG